jgi:hypothetical protein
MRNNSWTCEISGCRGGSMKFRAFWNVVPCSLEVDRHFGGAYCLHDSSPWWWRQYDLEGNQTATPDWTPASPLPANCWVFPSSLIYSPVSEEYFDDVDLPPPVPKCLLQLTSMEHTLFCQVCLFCCWKSGGSIEMILKKVRVFL